MLNEEVFNKELELENSDVNVEKNIQRYNEIVIPFYKNKGNTNQFIGVNDIPISCRIFTTPNAHAKIILCTGYNESYLKYSEIIMSLCEMGLSVYCLDHRGQGFSGRFPSQEKRGFVDKFSNFVDDLCFFYETVVTVFESNLPVFILAHSMGGCIATHAVCSKKIQPAGVILSAPMHGINLSPYPILELPTYLIANAMCKFGRDKEYAFGQTDCIPFRPFEGNDVTNSKFRYSVWRKHISEINDMQLGGPTFGWIKESIQASREARKMGQDNKVPFLLMQAECDTVVLNSAQDEFIKNCAHCEKVVFKNAKHEILMEINITREKALNNIQKFIMQHIQKIA